MARERKRGGGLALVQARQSRLTAARERQRAAKSRRGFEFEVTKCGHKQVQILGTI
jgi:hypothetical protein